MRFCFIQCLDATSNVLALSWWMHVSFLYFWTVACSLNLPLSSRQATKYGTSFEVRLHPFKGIDLTGLLHDLDYEHYEMFEPSESCPLSIFAAAPPFGLSVREWRERELRQGTKILEGWREETTSW